MQAPQGKRAQEALSALQAEVRCYSQQPAAVEAVAAAAAATPDTADQLLQRLNDMLQGMERRSEGGQGDPSAAPPTAASMALPASGSGRMAEAAAAGGPGVASSVPELSKAGATGDAAQRQHQQAAGDSEADLVAMLKSEVARLQRLQEANTMAERAVTSLLSKLSTVGPPAGEDAGGLGHRVAYVTCRCRKKRCYLESGHDIATICRNLCCW